MENGDDAILRTEIAACTRLLNAEGILGYSGHVSARLPDGGLLIQPFSTSRAELAPEDLIPCDADGAKKDPALNARPPSEVHIHTEIFRRRPDVNAIVHFHPETATLFTLSADVDLVPVKNHAYRWASGIPVHPDPGHIDSPQLGAELAETLDGHNAALLRAHGAVVVAESVRAVAIDVIHFEENAEAEFRAAQLGGLDPLTAEEMASFEARFDRDRHVAKLWSYYVGRSVEGGAIPPAWLEKLI